MNAQPAPEEEYERRGPWSRVKGWLFGEEEPEDEDEVNVPSAGANAAPGQRRQPLPLRLQTTRSGRVAVRRNAQVFEDAKAAADGLKGGEQQIVNLERASPQMTERIIDFLNGVCYALDGSVERVGEKVYMFVPANVTVEVDEGATAASTNRRPPFGEPRE
ncbi:MAG TPA: cell division protein SepF [Chthonomonadaceae bacterium]|nr:cell division protein SepF [Chthonomonadaceae bacterium]